MKYAVLDLEASGGNHRTTRITDIAIYIYDGEQVIDHYQTLVNPGKKIDVYVSKLTGITDKMVAKAPYFEQIAGKVQELIKGCLIVAHNVSFDYKLLIAEFRRLDINWRSDRLCTLELSRALLPELESHNLLKVAHFLGIENQSHHRADGDAKATVEILDKFLHDYKADKLVDEHILPFNDYEIEMGNSHLDDAEIDSLPEEPGVYIFKNEKNKIIYIGRDESIRKGVVNTLRNKGRKRISKHLDQVYHLEYEKAGNELTAELMYYELVFKFKPQFNENLVQLYYRFKLAIAEVEGFQYLGIFKADYAVTRTLAYHKDFKTAERTLQKLAAKYHLKKSQQHHSIKIKKRHAPNYKTAEGLAKANRNLDVLWENESSDQTSFFVLGLGSKTGMSTICFVNEDELVGWGEASLDGAEISFAELKKYIKQKNIVDGVHIVKRLLNYRDYQVIYEGE
ncbi:MAG: hypothetical protein KDC92_05875 [Bacteroidetes bacterium]|nr:hypothetical protein [Bacteroidota bacterium]